MLPRKPKRIPAGQEATYAPLGSLDGAAHWGASGVLSKMHELYADLPEDLEKGTDM